MNTKVLILGAVVAAFLLASSAAESFLSPRAAGKQIMTASMATRERLKNWL